MTEGSFRNIDDILTFAIEKEREAQETYSTYAKTTEKSGFRRLLLSMVAQEKDHEKILLELKTGKSTEAALSAESSVDVKIADYLVDVEFSTDMSYQDFLILVMKREEKAVQLYQYLKEQSDSSDAKSLFERLADEEKKHKAWAQDRYDLEILTDN